MWIFASYFLLCSLLLLSSGDSKQRLTGMGTLPLVVKEFTSEAMTPFTVTIPGSKTYDIVVERAAVESRQSRNH